MWTTIAIIDVCIKQELGPNKEFGSLVGMLILAGWLTRIFFDAVVATAFDLSVTGSLHRTFQVQGPTSDDPDA